MYLLTALGTMAAAMAGATAGASGLSAGVFHSRASTGRSRHCLFAKRTPGRLALLLPTTAVAYALERWPRWWRDRCR
jgi:hypothetical protein